MNKTAEKTTHETTTPTAASIDVAGLVKPRVGRPRAEVNLQLPAGDFTIDDLRAANNQYTMGVMNSRFRDLIAAGTVKVIGKVESALKGRKKLIYST